MTIVEWTTEPWAEAEDGEASQRKVQSTQDAEQALLQTRQ